MSRTEVIWLAFLAVMVFSFIGYTLEEVRAKDRTIGRRVAFFGGMLVGLSLIWLFAFLVSFVGLRIGYVAR